MSNIQMKDSGVSWIGEIPSHWEVKKLGDISNIYSGKGIKKDEYVDDGAYPIIGANGEIGRCNKYNNDKEVLTTGRVGTLGTVHRISKSWISDNTLIIDVTDKNTNLNYLYFVIKSLPFGDMKTGTAQPLMTATKLKECSIPIPPLAEQELIAGYLDEQSRKQSLLKHSEQISNLLQYKQSIISEYVTGKKQVTNTPVKMKDSGIDWIGQIPEDWGVKRLGDLVDITCGKYNSGDSVEDGAYTFFTANTTGDIKRINSYSFDCDAVLMARNGLAGFAQYYSGKFEISNHCFAITDKTNSLNMKFIYYYLVGNSDKLNEMVKGIAIPGIKKTSIQELALALPPIQIQNQIATKLDALIGELDNVINSSTAIIGELKSYKSALIGEFITGQKLVPGYSERERE